MENDIIFQPLELRNLTVKNCFFRSNISGRWDNSNGSGTQARINWEEKLARGGVGAIISSFTGNSNQGHPFGTALGEEDKKALIEYLKTL